MSEYGILAQCYDQFTRDIDYPSFADFYESIFQREGIAPKSILDLGCGTGTLTCLLAQRGYDTIGADRSVDMLSQAFDKAQELDGARPLFINQDMRELDLYGSVDCAVCCLDGINYLIDPKDCEKTFQRLSLFMEPGGIFIFDINSEYKLRSIDGGVFIDESDDSYCVWRTEFDRGDNLCFYGMDIFRKTSGGLWRRGFEEHYEYAYTTDQLKGMLLGAGFESVRVYGDRRLEPPTQEEGRIFITARRSNNQ